MLRRALLHGDLSESVIRCFYEVYNRLGGGLPEHVYMMALERELRWAGHEVSREVRVPVLYKGEVLTMLRIDAVVDGRLVVELKSTEVVHPGARRQLYNYLRCTRLEVGLLLHFGPNPRKAPLGAGSRHESGHTDEVAGADAPDTPDRASDPTHPQYPEHPS